MTELSLHPQGGEGYGQQNLLVVAAGVRMTQREQKPRPGREAARRGGGGEEQPNLSPKASEDEARETEPAKAAQYPQFFAEERRGGAVGLLSFSVPELRKCPQESSEGQAEVSVVSLAFLLDLASDQG